LDGNNDEQEVLQLTAEERRVIQQARASGMSLAQLLEGANQEGKSDEADPNRALTRAEVDALLEKRDKREAMARARGQKVAQMQDRVQTRVAGHERLRDKQRRVALIGKQVMERIPETPSLVEAKTEADFYGALDTLVDQVVTEELSDIDNIATAQSQAELDATLDAEREGGPGTGGPTSTAQGDDTPTPAGEVDWAENPVYGLSVDQPSEVDLEQAFQKDMKRFGKKHDLRISA